MAWLGRERENAELISIEDLVRSYRLEPSSLISYAHFGPSGSFETGRQSIVSMKPSACLRQSQFVLHGSQSKLA